MLQTRTRRHFRRGIHPQDLTQFLIATAMSLLLGIISGSENADVARHYIEVFVTTINQNPPRPRAVFPRASDKRLEVLWDNGIPISSNRHMRATQ